MKTLDAEKARLAEALEKIVVLIEAHGDHHHGDAHYAKWAAGDAESLRQGDLHGAEHFLSGFHGSGDFNDVVLLDAQADKKMRRLFDVAIASAKLLLRVEGPERDRP